MSSVVFKRAYAIIRYHPDFNILELTWRRWAKSDEYREVLVFCGDYISKHEIKYWLSDLRCQGAVSPTDSKWLIEQILPAIYKAGLVKLAFITDSDVFKKYYTSSIKRAEISQNVSIELFHHFGSAKNWLCSTQIEVSSNT